jgi:serine/threonine-protein kinase
VTPDRVDDPGDTLPLPPEVEHPAELPPGTLIHGQYRVVRSLGAGGMGQVVLARDEALDRDVAIKVIRPELVASTKAREDFVTEARSMARLVHPNVVSVYAVGELEGSPYLVMEYVPGEALSTLLAKRNGPLGIDEAAFVLDQICRGLAAMHAAGVVHRDLKPANVLIGPGFRVAIADLGIARLVGDGREEDDSRISGTPSYMAPEIRLGSGTTPELAPRADLFSLGVMAYQLLTGELPYRRALVAGLTKPRAASRRRPTLPAKVDAVLESALELFPEQRAHSVDAFRRALLDALREHAAAAHAPDRILVVDDDPSYRDLTRFVLARAFPDATLECAPDGRTALEHARRAAPDLVVSDLDMPGMDGAALTAALRALPGGDAIPIVVCTAIAGPTDWRLLTRLGADGFLGKPYEPSQLVALARAVLDARSAR